MALRNALAGPSRLPQAVPKVQSRHRQSQPPIWTPIQKTWSRCFFTVPHPDLKAKGTRHVFIRTPEPIASVAHAYAISRAVEAYFGQSVVSLDLPHNHDSLRPERSMTLQLLRPVDIPKSFTMYTPNPIPSSEEQIMWGPSLEEVQGVLQKPASYVLAEDVSTQPANSLRFKVEPTMFPAPPAQHPPRMMTMGKERRKELAAKYRKEDEEIVAALRRFGGGFYGGFEGVTDNFTRVRPPRPAANEEILLPLPEQADSGLSSSQEDWTFNPSASPAPSIKAEYIDPRSPPKISLKPSSGFSLPMPPPRKASQAVSPKKARSSDITKKGEASNDDVQIADQKQLQERRKRHAIEEQLKLMAMSRDAALAEESHSTPESETSLDGQPIEMEQSSGEAEKTSETLAGEDKGPQAGDNGAERGWRKLITGKWF